MGVLCLSFTATDSLLYLAYLPNDNVICTIGTRVQALAHACACTHTSQQHTCVLVTLCN